MNTLAASRPNLSPTARIIKTMRTYGQETVVFIALVVLTVVVGLINPNFLSAANLNNNIHNLLISKPHFKGHFP